MQHLLRNIHHIAIIAGDYQKSKWFYTEVLGCTVLAEVYRAERQSYKLDLAVNGIYQIELFSFPDSRPRASFPEAKGLRHLAFAVQDIEAAIAHIAAFGIEVQPIRVDEFTRKRFTFFNDPDGQPLELYEDVD